MHEYVKGKEYNVHIKYVKCLDFKNLYLDI